MTLSLESNPSYIDSNARARDQDGGEGDIVGEAKNDSEKDTMEEVPRSTAEETHDERPTQPSASFQAGFGLTSTLV
ncbi:unnamed protein product [Peniophora sp. CBMAI 1063]|nr:unnamed protein product [Peniophora sp. CBMAI 1063]